MATDKQKSKTRDRKINIRNKKRSAKGKESKDPSGGESNKFSRRKLKLPWAGIIAQGSDQARYLILGINV